MVKWVLGKAEVVPEGVGAHVEHKSYRIGICLLFGQARTHNFGHGGG